MLRPVKARTLIPNELPDLMRNSRRVALWLLAALSTFTAASRVLWIMKKLQPKATTATTSPYPLSARTVHPLLSSAITPVHSMAVRDTAKTPTGSADVYRR